MKLVLFCFAILAVLGTSLYAENTWNIVTSERADTDSRVAGENVLTGAISVFEALRSAERRQYEISFGQLRAAAEQYRSAAVVLNGIAEYEEASIKISVASLTSQEAVGLFLWYESYSKDPFAAVESIATLIVDADRSAALIGDALPQLQQLSAADLLRVAALHCDAIASVLLNSDSEVGVSETKAVDPTRLAVLTSQAALIVTVGNIATEVFSNSL